VGEGKILEFAPTAVRISQDIISHQKISRFFADVEATLQGRPTVTLDPKVQGVLRKQIALPAGDAALEAQLKSLLTGVNYLIDRTALADEGIDLTTVSAPPAGKAQVGKHLQELCEQNNLTWKAQEGVILISTAVENMETRLYNVAKHITPEMGPLEIAAKVRSSPELGDWAESGEGLGNCQYLGPLLVIYQTKDSHERIAEALQ
jgi:hypothetical protein